MLSFPSCNISSTGPLCAHSQSFFINIFCTLRILRRPFSFFTKEQGTHLCPQRLVLLMFVLIFLFLYWHPSSFFSGGASFTVNSMYRLMYPDDFLRATRILYYQRRVKECFYSLIIPIEQERVFLGLAVMLPMVYCWEPIKYLPLVRLLSPYRRKGSLSFSLH